MCREERESSSGGFAGPAANLRWIDLLRIRESWGLITAKFLSDAAWYFLPFLASEISI